jgi:hypothetical protein
MFNYIERKANDIESMSNYIEPKANDIDSMFNYIDRKANDIQSMFNYIDGKANDIERAESRAQKRELAVGKQKRTNPRPLLNSSTPSLHHSPKTEVQYSPVQRFGWYIHSADN